jgi:crossover junction endodeoxyribonuclease RuvC
MTKILGIDPGLNITGWGIIKVINNHDISFIEAGTIKTDVNHTLAERLGYIYSNLVEIIKLHQPDECAIEETFINTNARSSLKLGHARGAAMLAVTLSGLSIREYAATLVKKTVVGVGRAEKEQIKIMVKTLLPNAKVLTSDAADALAIAICHMGHRKVLI